MFQMDWWSPIISQPHQISVDEDGKIVPCVVAGSPMANQSCWHKLCGFPGEAIQGSRDREGSIWIEDLGVFRHDPFHASVARYVGDQHRLVIQQKLSKARVGPPIVEIL